MDDYRQKDGQTQTDRRTDDGHKVMGKALADIVSWAKMHPFANKMNKVNIFLLNALSSGDVKVKC